MSRPLRHHHRDHVRQGRVVPGEAVQNDVAPVAVDGQEHQEEGPVGVVEEHRHRGAVGTDPGRRTPAMSAPAPGVPGGDGPEPGHERRVGERVRRGSSAAVMSAAWPAARRASTDVTVRSAPGHGRTPRVRRGGRDGPVGETVRTPRPQPDSRTSTALPLPHQRQVTVLDRLVEHLDVLDGQVPADRVVVERPCPPGGDDVEPGQVAARRAAVADHAGGPGGPGRRRGGVGGRPIGGGAGGPGGGGRGGG